MHVTLDPAAKEEESALANLMQLYAYDFSNLVGLDVGDDGRFEDRPLTAYWTDAWRHPFLLRVDGKLAGFALVQSRSRLTSRDGVFDMAEFFVLRRFRRAGVGRSAACLAFDRFTGEWEVRQRAANVAATAFWRATVGAYTADKFEDLDWKDEVWMGPVQRFRS